MKKGFVVICMFSIGIVARSAVLPFTGTVTPTTLGETLTTDLPEFDNSLGTLTAVDISLDLTFTPYASLISIGGDGVFLSTQSISFSYTSANILTLTHGTDNWSLSAPTVGTGIITGSDQTIPAFPATLKLLGNNSAPLSWSASGVDLIGYVGAGTLNFDTAGAGNVIASAGLFAGGGADLTGTASVVYAYDAIPEPASLGLLALVTGGIYFTRRFFTV